MLSSFWSESRAHAVQVLRLMRNLLLEIQFRNSDVLQIFKDLDHIDAERTTFEIGILEQNISESIQYC